MTLSTNPYRLARSVIPSAYRIFLTPNLEAFTFAGRVEIDVEIKESINELTLHAVELDLGAATISVEGTSYRSHEHHRNETFQTVTFAFDRQLPTGPAVVEIAFDGTLNDQLHGFYRSTFTDEHGVAHTIATTQFEHSDARRAFPCWDEPAFKATYQVNLTIPSHLSAYSNSLVTTDTDLGNGQRTVSFATTMKMSTYLVAFVIGPFEETAALDVDGVALRVICPIGKAHLADFALGAGAFALHFFSNYFDIPYPGDKLDMLAIPDFAAGAMENLGAITYRETALLVDPAQASVSELQRVGEVVAHEIAHMWFGDLVTMQWWEGIWLNEAFATFMQILCMNAYRPEWKMWVNFGVDRDAALAIDGLHTTRAIEFEVISPADVRGMFDVLTYEKGGSVLRMLEQYLGETTFRDGIRHYLRTHAYANTVTSDLWEALEEVSAQPVKDMMNTWILQGGHPLVTLTNGVLSQQPFAYGPARGESAIGSTWMVPVLTRSLSGGATSRHLLAEAPLALSDASPVIVNAEGSGVFRSRYDTGELKVLASRLGELHELERATLVADTWALLLAGQIDWGDFLALARGLDVLDEPAPWKTLETALDYVDRALRADQREGFVHEVKELFYPQFTRLGWNRREGESELTAQVRATVLGVLGTIVGDPDVQGVAVSRFEANDLDGDLARSILRVVAHQDRPGDYETFLERYRHAQTPQEGQRYQYVGLCAFNDERVALDAAEKCFSEFRVQDAPGVLGLLSRNATTGPSVWRFLTQRWDEALARFPANTHVRMTSGISTYFKDEDFAKTVEAFHRDHPLGGEQRQVDQALEQMNVGLAFAAATRRQF